MLSTRSTIAGLALIAASAPAHADITISTAATQNMSCSDGTCVPTATKAVLNATDLESDLSQFGNVRVMTAGNGVEANNIKVKAAFSSPDSTSLTLDAHRAITVDAAVSIGSATAELELQSDTLAASDTLSFGKKGHITFGSLSDIFGINGGIFTLVGSVQGLASAAAVSPSGAIAFANSYNASQDGTYTTSPVATTFTGLFEGLGNTISNLSIIDPASSDNVGLFSVLGTSGNGTSIVVNGIRLEKARVHASTGSAVGTIAGLSYGAVSESSASGKVFVDDPGQAATAMAGGLIGYAHEGHIISSSADVHVSAEGEGDAIGGLVGAALGTLITKSHATGSTSGLGAWLGGLIGSVDMVNVHNCYATGEVTSRFDQSSQALGGLIAGGYEVRVRNSYATGDVTANVKSPYATVGGLIGETQLREVTTSYSTGVPTSSFLVGGFIGYDYNTGLKYTYWDTTTSGTETGLGFHDGGKGQVTGLTTEQLQSGLPSGFDPNVWAEEPKINNGLPYLINYPPPK